MVRKNNQLRMTLSFNSEYTMKLFRGLAEEEAFKNRTSESYEIINRFIGSFDFPNQEDACDMVMMLYGGKGLKTAIQNFCAYQAIGDGWKTRNTNNRPIIQFVYDLGLRWQLDIDPKKDVYREFLSDFGQLVHVMENQNECDNGENSQIIKEEVKTGKNLLDLYTREIPPAWSTFMSYILSNWSVLGTSTFTFRALTCYISATEGWLDQVEQGKEEVINYSDTAIKARQKFIKLITEASAEWED